MKTLTVRSKAFTASALVHTGGMTRGFEELTNGHRRWLAEPDQKVDPVGSSVTVEDDVLLVFAEPFGGGDRLRWKLVGLTKSLLPARTAKRLEALEGTDPVKLPIIDARRMSKRLNLNAARDYVSVVLGRDAYQEYTAGEELAFCQDTVAAWWSNTRTGEITIARQLTVTDDESKALSVLMCAHDDIHNVGTILRPTQGGGLVIQTKDAMRKLKDTKYLREHRELLPIPAVAANPAGLRLAAAQYLDDPGAVWSEPATTLRGEKAWVVYGIRRARLEAGVRTAVRQAKGTAVNRKLPADIADLDTGIECFL